MRRYASVVFAVVMCPSVCLSVTSRCCIETTKRIETRLAWGLFPPILYCVRKIFGYLQNKGTSLWNFAPNYMNVENFATASRSRCQPNSSTIEFVDDTYATVNESWLFTAHRSAVTRYLHYFDLLLICCTTCSYSYATVDKILTDSASRGPSAIAELFVIGSHRSL